MGALETSLLDLEGAISPVSLVRVMWRVNELLKPYIWVPAQAAVVGVPHLEDPLALDQVEELILTAVEELPCH
ncbi:hypothetical protein [Nocardiopsis metallicus]|uniref:Uncharacterized protein n=1 Tax=Nocardiopsis metallicus TaxID=179819 RepID=A0A840WT51_9ACTN|nr:hypothetical protein [Nocardiopsis metallicus]MBB5494737.1 hypothetical protein [Nocardiopsis metallicus]